MREWTENRRIAVTVSLRGAKESHTAAPLGRHRHSRQPENQAQAGRRVSGTTSSHSPAVCSSRVGFFERSGDGAFCCVWRGQRADFGAVGWVLTASDGCCDAGLHSSDIAGRSLRRRYDSCAGSGWTIECNRGATRIWTGVVVYRGVCSEGRRSQAIVCCSECSFCSSTQCSSASGNAIRATSEQSSRRRWVCFRFQQSQLRAGCFLLLVPYCHSRVFQVLEISVFGVG